MSSWPRSIGTGVLVLALVLSVSASAAPGTSASAADRALHATLGPRITLGWNLTTPELVADAARRGVTIAVLYQPAPAPTSSLGQALSASGMHVVSAEISLRVADLECARTRTVAPPPQGAAPYCDSDPGDDTGHRTYSVDDLVADARSIAARDGANPLVVGHWILDDVAGWDTGGLRGPLEQVARILPPSQATLCGFSAAIGTAGTAPWDPRRAANFSSRACDAVAPYIYSAPVNINTERPTVDWAMDITLPMVLDSLRRVGWQQDSTPLIGVGQAWSGVHRADQAVQFAPTPDQMTTQARAFRASGAIGLGWYAWSLSDYPSARTPANDPGIGAGVAHASRIMDH